MSLVAAHGRRSLSHAIDMNVSNPPGVSIDSTRPGRDLGHSNRPLEAVAAVSKTHWPVKVPVGCVPFSWERPPIGRFSFDGLLARLVVGIVNRKVPSGNGVGALCFS